MTNDLKISRELAEELELTARAMGRLSAAAELRALLAAPVVERQETAEAILLSDCVELNHKAYGAGYFGTEVAMLYTSPPAPVAVVLPERMPTGNNVEGEHNRLSPGVREGWNACLDKVKELNK